MTGSKMRVAWNTGPQMVRPFVRLHGTTRTVVADQASRQYNMRPSSRAITPAILFGPNL